MLFDEPANRLHAIGFRVPCKCLWTASQTGAISRLLGGDRCRKELDILPARTPCRTRRPAIHSGRRHCKNELTVLASIARNHGFPAWIVRTADLHRFGTRSHGFQAFRSEYGIRCHNKKRVGHGPRNGLSESCGQIEFVKRLLPVLSFWVLGGHPNPLCHLRHRTRTGKVPPEHFSTSTRGTLS